MFDIIIRLIQKRVKIKWWVAQHWTGKGVPILIAKRMPWPPLCTIFYTVYGPFHTDIGAKAQMRYLLIRQGESIADIDEYLGRPNESLGW